MSGQRVERLRERAADGAWLAARGLRKVADRLDALGDRVDPFRPRSEWLALMQHLGEALEGRGVRLGHLPGCRLDNNHRGVCEP